MYYFRVYNVKNRRKVYPTAVHSFSKYLDSLRFLFHLFPLCVFVSYKQRMVAAKLTHTTLVNQIFVRLKNLITYSMDQSPS